MQLWTGGLPVLDFKVKSIVHDYEVKFINYSPAISLLIACLLLNVEFWILGPFSFVQSADNADIEMSYYIRLVANFFEYGPTYWADYMSIGVDRLSSTLSLLRFPALLLIIFPDWTL